MKSVQTFNKIKVQPAVAVVGFVHLVLLLLLLFLSVYEQYVHCDDYKEFLEDISVLPLDNGDSTDPLHYCIVTSLRVDAGQCNNSVYSGTSGT